MPASLGSASPCPEVWVPLHSLCVCVWRGAKRLTPVKEHSAGGGGSSLRLELKVHSWLCFPFAEGGKKRSISSSLYSLFPPLETLKCFIY